LKSSRPGNGRGRSNRNKGGKERVDEKTERRYRRDPEKDIMEDHLRRVCDYLNDIQSVIEDESQEILKYDGHISTREGEVSQRAYYDSKLSKTEILRQILRGAMSTKNVLKKSWRKDFFTLHNYRLGIRSRMDSCDASSVGYRYRPRKEREHEEFFERDRTRRDRKVGIFSHQERDDNGKPHRAPGSPLSRDQLGDNTQKHSGIVRSGQSHKQSKKAKKSLQGSKKELWEWRAKGRPRTSIRT